ncbi:hypothetical protein YSY43_38050 [Paenibacillus sp. YSY-4.3]
MRKYERLYEFIPFFETVLIDEAVRWGSGGQDTKGTITLAYPTYHQRVIEFNKVIHEEGLLEPDYLNIIQSYGIETIEELDRAIDGFDHKLSIAILTYYVRQERFSDGLWANAIENKIFLRLLKRLFELENKGELQ